MDVVRRLVDGCAPGAIVEVGPGMGAAGWYLSQGREYVGFEPDSAAARVATERLVGHPMAAIFNESLPVPPTETYDALVAFEVLEHIEDDRLALSQWTDWVVPGGRIIVSVPAKQSRFGPIDTAVGHYRRYDKEVLRRLLTDSGLTEVAILSYGMPLGYLLEWVRNRILAKQLSHEEDMRARSHRSGRAFQPQAAGALIRALVYPFVIMQRPFVSSDWGIGWIATGVVQ